MELSKKILLVVFFIIEAIEISLSIILVIKSPDNPFKAIIFSRSLCNIILSISYVLDNFNLLKSCKNDIINNYYICSIGLCIMLLLTTCIHIYYLVIHLISGIYFMILILSNICNILIIIVVYYYITKYKEKIEEYDNL